MFLYFIANSKIILKEDSNMKYRTFKQRGTKACEIDTPDEIIAVLRDGNLAEKQYVLLNPLCPRDALVDYAATTLDQIWYPLSNPKAEGINVAMGTIHFANYDSLANFPLSEIPLLNEPCDVHLFIRDGEDFHRILALTNPSCPKTDMENYSESVHPLYLAALLSNPALPEEIRVKLENENMWRTPYPHAKIGLGTKEIMEYIRSLSPYMNEALEASVIFEFI